MIADCQARHSACAAARNLYGAHTHTHTHTRTHTHTHAHTRGALIFRWPATAERHPWSEVRSEYSQYRTSPRSTPDALRMAARCRVLHRMLYANRMLCQLFRAMWYALPPVVLHHRPRGCRVDAACRPVRWDHVRKQRVSHAAVRRADRAGSAVRCFRSCVCLLACLLVCSDIRWTLRFARFGSWLCLTSTATSVSE